MKTFNVLTAFLFGSVAFAAPVQKRALVTKTEVIVHTEVIYTTVYANQGKPAQATTTTPGLFYERPPAAKTSSKASSSSSSSSSSSTSTSAVYTPPPVVEASSSTPPITTSSLPPPPPPPSSTEAPPSETSSPPIPSVVPIPSSTPSPSLPSAPSPTVSPPTGGNVHHGEITVYDPAGGYGACGTQLQDSHFVAAISGADWGESTYDVATGAATNPWCGKPVTVSLNGKTVDVKIMDRCEGCVSGDIDLARGAWNALTGSADGTRLPGSWTS